MSPPSSCLFFTLLCLIGPASCIVGGVRGGEISDEVSCDVPSSLPFCIPDEDYDKHQRPVPTEPTQVYVLMHVVGIEEISDSDLTMTLHVDFDIRWKEPRLSLTENRSIWDPFDPRQEWQVVDQELVEKHLWVPDLTVYNMKGFHQGSVLRPNGMAKIFRDKTLHYIVSSRVTVGCNFYFESFPLDRQMCEFFVGSYGLAK